MLLMNGLVQDFNFAATIEGRAEPFSTQMYLPMPDGRTTLANFFSPLVNNMEKMFLTGKSDLSGGAHAADHGLDGGGRGEPVPQAGALRDAAPGDRLPTRESTFWRTKMLTRRLSETAPARLRRRGARRSPARRHHATIYRYLSHAQHMGDRFLVGYPHDGAWHKPDMKVVSLYVDQKPEGDLSAARARSSASRFIRRSPKRCAAAADKLAVDAVLIIGEHGNYPRNEKGQILYPRYEFFEQCVEVFEKDGRAVPVYNDKHLSYSFEKAKWMVEASQRLGFPMLAGSSLPVTWRLPDIELPLGCEIEDALMVGEGGSDPMDFHALEGMQCMVERRKGGETGVKAVQLIEGDAVWKAGDEGRWSKELLTAALSRSDTPLGLTGEGRPHAGPGGARELPKLVKNPAAYFIEYRDGLKATLLMLNGAVQDFNFAARRRRERASISTQFLLTPDAERDLLGVPGAKGRADVRDRRGAVSGGAHAADQRHAGELPDVEGGRPHAAGDAAFGCDLPGAGGIAVLPELRGVLRWGSLRRPCSRSWDRIEAGPRRQGKWGA